MMESYAAAWRRRCTAYDNRSALPLLRRFGVSPAGPAFRNAQRKCCVDAAMEPRCALGLECMEIRPNRRVRACGRTDERSGSFSGLTGRFVVPTVDACPNEELRTVQ